MKPRLLTTARLSFPLASAIAALLATQSLHAADATWGANSGSAWYTGGNWSPAASPGLQGGAASNTDIATFTSAFTGTTVGINMNATGAFLNLGAISLDATRTTATTIGNSSTTVVAGQVLRLYGATVGGNANTILSNAGTGLLTIQNTQGSGNQFMGVVLSNTTDNIINASGTGGITISSIVSQSVAGNKLTKTGANVLTLSGANTFSGGVTIKAGTVSSGSATAMGTGTVTIGDSANTGAAATWLSTTNTFTYTNAISTTGTGTNSILVTGFNPIYSGAITLGSNLSVISSNTGGSTISSTGGISGTGNLTIQSNAANTASSAITFSGATLNFTGSITNSGTTTSTTLSNTLISSVIGTNVTGITQNSTNSQLTLSGNNTFTGNVTITTGQLNVSGARLLSTSGALGNSTTAGRTVTIASGGTLNFSTNDVMGDGGSAPALSIIANGGTIRNGFNGINSLGPVQLNGGTLTSIATGTAGFKPTGTITVGGSAVSTISGTGVFGSSSAITYNVADVVAGSDLNVTAVVGDQFGTGGIIKTGVGTMTLSATNTFTGNTTISNGALSIATTGALPGFSTNGRYSVANGATLAVYNAVTDANITSMLGTTNFAAGSALGFDTTTASRTYSAVLANTAQGALGLTKLGANTLTIDQANTFTGPTIINQGTLALGNANALQNTSGITMANGTTLQSTVINTVVNAPIGITTAATFQNNAPSSGTATRNLTLGGAISGTGNVTFTADFGSNSYALTILNAASTYVGNTTITTSVGNQMSLVRLGIDNALPIATQLTITGNDTTANRVSALDLRGFNQEIGGLTAGVTTNRGLRVINSLNNTVAGTLTINTPISTSFTFAGQIGNGTSPGTLTGSSFNLEKKGAGTQILTGTNDFTGSTIISGGILSLGNAAALRNSAFDTATSILGTAGDGLRTTVTTLTLGGLTGGNSFASRFTSTTGGYTGLTALTLNPGTGATPSYSGDVGNGNGSMTLIKSGAGTQTLTAAQSYTGLTTVSAGALNIGSAGSLNSGNALTVDVSGTADFANAGQTLGAVSNSNTAVSALNFSAATGTVTLASLTGTGNTRFGSNGIVTGGIATGTVTSVGALTANITGGTTTAGGLLTGTISSGTVGAGSLSSTSVTGGTNTITGAAGITTLNGGTTTVGGVATIGTMTSGTANLNGATSAITTLNGGTVNLGTTVLTVSNGTTSGAITGANGALTKDTVGTLTLSGTSTYTGATTVSAGTLVVNGGGITSNVTVASGATLGGTGTIGGSVTLNGGTYAVGNSPGTQTVTGGLDFGTGAGSIFAWDLEITDPSDTASATTYDRVTTPTVVGTGAVFSVVLGTSNFASNFWTQNHTWSNIFTTDGVSAFTSNWANAFSSVTTNLSSGVYGSFSFTPDTNSLTWSAVPEPSSVLAGLLLGAGLLRRRRNA